jgi:hypothetical protein
MILTAKPVVEVDCVVVIRSSDSQWAGCREIARTHGVIVVVLPTGAVGAFVRVVSGKMSRQATTLFAAREKCPQPF